RSQIVVGDKAWVETDGFEQPRQVAQREMTAGGVAVSAEDGRCAPGDAGAAAQVLSQHQQPNQLDRLEHGRIRKGLLLPENRVLPRQRGPKVSAVVIENDDGFSEVRQVTLRQRAVVPKDGARGEATVHALDEIREGTPGRVRER